MSILFSRQCEYALQAVTFLALKPKGEMTSIKTLTRQLKIPYHFLGKILQQLVLQGLLISQKGPTGGFALKGNPKDITLFQIVDAIDGQGFMHRCVLGFPDCGGDNPCSVHQAWGKVRNGIHTMLIHKSIAEMAKTTKKPAFMK